MPRAKHRRKGQSRQQRGQTRGSSQLVAETIWETAAEWDWETRQKGHHGGIIGRSARRVLRVLLFDDRQNARSRPLDLSLDALTIKATMSRSTAIKAVRRLQELGMLRRQESRDEAGRQTHIYTVLQPAQ